MIVSDAGPIIIFARVRRLPLLREVTGSLIIPAAVHDEILVKQGSMPGAAEVAQTAWIQRVVLVDRSIPDSLPPALHEGEREAIALARERRAQLLVDEIRARSAAIQLGIDVIGTRASSQKRNSWGKSLSFGRSSPRCNRTDIASTEL